MIHRDLVKIPQRESFFILGPRQTGKSTLIRSWLNKKKYFEVDLLRDTDLRKYSREPDLLIKEVEFQIEEHGIKHIFIDEIQKIPALLNPIQSLIDRHKVQFILSGSSARKLTKMHGNLLGGRAQMIYLFPLTFFELEKHFKFERFLQFGGLAGIIFDSNLVAQKKLQAYVQSYLKEEIAQEGIVRNLLPFSRFLDLAGHTTTQVLNFENIAREAAIPSKTIASYYQILEDTFMGYFLPAWDLSVRKQLSKHSKFYFFDNGITSCLNDNLGRPLSSDLRGAHFEQGLINEIRAVASYLNAEVKLHYWRTQAGSEVDLILSRGGNPFAAIEMKNRKKIVRKDFSGLLSFSEEYPRVKNLFCVSDVSAPYKEGAIQVLPWEYFLKSKLRALIA